jgi:WD40 repeat protein
VVGLVVALDRFAADQPTPRGTSSSRAIDLGDEFISHAAFDQRAENLVVLEATGRASFHALSPVYARSDWSAPSSAFRGAFDPAGRVFATAHFDRTLRIWGTRGPRLLETWDAALGQISALAFSPDGQILAIASDDGRITLREVETGLPVARFTTTRSYPRSLAFSPSKALLAAGEADGQVLIFDLTTGRMRPSPAGHRVAALALAFSPDGRILATGSPADPLIQLWDVPAEATLTTLPTPGDAVSCLRFAPDGRTLASGHTSGAIRLWDLATPSSPRPLHEHKDWVIALAWSPDGSLLRSVSRGEGPARSWDIVPGAATTANAHTISTTTGRGHPD